MATLAINEDNMKRLQAGRTVKDFAAEVGVDAGTMSRLLAGKAAPGEKVITGFLTNYPYPFDHFFTVSDEERDTRADAPVEDSTPDAPPTSRIPSTISFPATDQAREAS